MLDTTPDPTPGNYYATVIDGPNVGFLAGPFPRHVYAMACVGGASAAARKVNDRAGWYAYGTAKREQRTPGILNDMIDVRDAVRRNVDRIVNARAGRIDLNVATKREEETARDAGRVLDYQRNRRRMRGTLHAPLIVRRFGRDYLLND